MKLKVIVGTPLAGVLKIKKTSNKYDNKQMYLNQHIRGGILQGTSNIVPKKL